jgi:D-cysteine desulfhydrase
LDRLFGAEIFYVSDKEYYAGMADFRAALDGQIRAQGGKMYFIPEGGSNGLGVYGYAAAFREIEGQAKAGEVPGLDGFFDSVVVANGSGGTQAGLILGKLLSGEAAAHTRIVGVNVCYDGKESFRLVKEALWSAIQLRRLPLSFASSDIEVLEGFLGKGYAISTSDELHFLKKVASSEGVLLDPVSTGKAFRGLFETVKREPDCFGKDILFIHTGGEFGLFKLEEEWGAAL